MPQPYVARIVLLVHLQMPLSAKIEPAHPTKHEGIAQIPPVPLHRVYCPRQSLVLQGVGDTLGRKELAYVVESEPTDVLKQRDVSHFVAGDDVLEHDRVTYGREVLVAAVLVVAELLSRG
jgi:hypothetical protein